jgi:hypothetical protein
MLRTILLGTGALALGLGVATGGGGIAGATRPPTQLAGPVNCSAAGMMKFSPKIVNGGSSSETVTLRMKLTNCSGAGTSSGGVTMTKGNLVATTAAPFTNNCGPILTGSSLPAFSGVIKWKGSGGQVTPTNVTVSNADLFYNSGTDTLTAYLTTVSLSSGSYTGQSMQFSNLVASKDALKTTASCGAHGIGSVKFGASGGTVSVGG